MKITRKIQLSYSDAPHDRIHDINKNVYTKKWSLDGFQNDSITADYLENHPPFFFIISISSDTYIIWHDYNNIIHNCASANDKKTRCFAKDYFDNNANASNPSNIEVTYIRCYG